MEPAKLGMLSANNSVFFLCDIQEKFKNAMLHFDDVVKSAQVLLEAAKILSVPLIVTEQYPKGLGHTVADLDISKALVVSPKTRFSMLTPEVLKAMEALGPEKHSIVLFGIEAHVCVEQTALELREKGYNVHIVADASTSRTQEDRLLAFERLKQAGCFITTREAVIFKLVGDKDHPKFNDIRPLFSKSMTSTGLVPKL